MRFIRQLYCYKLICRTALSSTKWIFASWGLWIFFCPHQGQIYHFTVIFHCEIRRIQLLFVVCSVKHIFVFVLLPSSIESTEENEICILVFVSGGQRVWNGREFIFSSIYNILVFAFLLSFYGDGENILEFFFLQVEEKMLDGLVSPHLNASGLKFFYSFV